MENTLHDGEYVQVEKAETYQRGDIVLCAYPGRETTRSYFGIVNVTSATLFVKRLVALPGDTVEIRDGCLYVNGDLVPDPETLGSAPRQNYGPITLGEDEYFVLGDHRAASHDSRHSDVGPLPLSMLLGKVTRVILPLRDARPVQ